MNILRTSLAALLISTSWAGPVLAQTPPTLPAPDTAPPVTSNPAAPAPGEALGTEPAEAPKPAPRIEAKPVALVLRGLDKMTGKASEIVAPINKPVPFATLTINVRTCYSTPPTEPPETTAYVEVTDKRPGQDPKKVFAGWMFASTPSISAVEHPLYDVWVITCKTDAPGIAPSVTPLSTAVKPVSPDKGANEAPPELPEGAGR